MTQMTPMPLPEGDPYAASTLILHRLLTILLLNMTSPILVNSVDPDQLASEEAN